MNPMARISFGFAGVTVLGLMAVWLLLHYQQITIGIPSWLIMIVGVPALLLSAGLCLAVVIRAGK